MRAFPLIALLSVVWVFAACGDENSGPSVASLMPAAAAPGSTVEVLGDGFCGAGTPVNGDGTCGETVEGTVSFGADQSLRGLVSAWADSRITVTVPASAPAGATVVVVTVNGVSSDPIDFEVQ
jgi:uncharacterized protein (TIGR03437 family)